MTERRIVFHRLVRRDMEEILRNYHDQASPSVADRFFETFLSVVEQARENPQRFHRITPLLRKGDVTGFPYHFLYRNTDKALRVLVLRHDRRHPSFGLRRK